MTVDDVVDAVRAPGAPPLDDALRTALIEELARARTGYGLEGDLEDAASDAASPGPAPTQAEAHRRSPACGDEVTVRITVRDGVIADLRWTGHGCLVSTASGAVLGASAPGLAVGEFTALASRFFASVAPGGGPLDGDLEPFAGIGRLPLRAGCASLAWRTALDALARERGAI